MVRIGSLQLRETELSRKKGIALFNSSSPWASDGNDLRALYSSPYTSAVTTRTAVITQKDIDNITAAIERQDDAELPFVSSFAEDKRIHTSSFLKDTLVTIEGGRFTIARGSLNSYGYSPHSLSAYLSWLAAIFKAGPNEDKKPVIVSITGPADVIEATVVFLRRWIVKVAASTAEYSSILAVEINLSCPNIKGNDCPSGYDGSSVAEYVAAADRGNKDPEGGPCKLSIGLKLPPYTYQAQFKALIQALSSAPRSEATSSHPIAFLTSTNTLGSSYWLNEGEHGEMNKALPSISSAVGEDACDGTGGLAGESLHPIALGNVYKISTLLKASTDTRLHLIDVIGVGGVMSGLSAQRMRSAGASAVALATALGREGVDVFERISKEIVQDLD